MTEALNRWHAAWEEHEKAAQEAFVAAFPSLENVHRDCHCFGPTMRWPASAEGSGRVCLDDHGRATIKFAGVPKEAVGEVMLTCYGPNWFSEGPDGFAGAEPGGPYEYEDESTWAEYSFEVNLDGTADVAITYERIDNVVAILDLLETALAKRREDVR